MGPLIKEHLFYLLLSLTENLKFSKFPSVNVLTFLWLQANKRQWPTYQIDHCADENNLEVRFPVPTNYFGKREILSLPN